MGLGPIQFGGLASGLDTNAIITTLVALESRPIALLESQRAVDQNKISLFGTLESLVQDLQAKAKLLADPDSFFAQTLNSTDEAVAGFTLSSGAQAGSHTLTVDALAAADSWTFDAVADDDTNLGVGAGETVDFTYDGTVYSVSIDSANSSLNDIAAAINTAAGDDVTASVINVGTSSSPSYQLVLSGDDTGADYAITGLTSSVPGLVNPSNLSTASNAQITLDGLQVQRSTNDFTDVLAGVSITAQEALGTTTFTIATDIDATKTQLQEFIDSYNAVVSFVNGQNDFDPDAGPGGDLFGDSALSTVTSTISSALFDVDLATVQADTTGYSTLGLIGIDVQSDGTLLIDDATFDAKFLADPSAVSSLFSDSTTGLAVTLDTDIEAMTATTTAGTIEIEGLFDRRRTTLNDLIASYDDQIEDLEYRLDQFEENLVQRFANLESVMAQLNAQSSYLASQLASTRPPG